MLKKTSIFLTTLFCDIDTTASVEPTQEKHDYVIASVPKKPEKPVPAKRKCVRQCPALAYQDAASATSTPPESNQETPYEIMSISGLVPDSVPKQSKLTEMVQGATAACRIPDIKVDKSCNTGSKFGEKNKLSTSESITDRPSTLELPSPSLQSVIHNEEWMKTYTVEKIARNAIVSNSNNF